MSLIQPLLTSEQQNEIASYINIYRTKNQAPPMMWDNTIATFSQNWSYHLDASNTFVHSNTQLYGENLAYFQGYGKDIMTILKIAVDNWYNEISSYDFNNPGFSEATGHFTCLVWVSSIIFGIGITINPNTYVAVVVFNTAPPGNVIGQFRENVLPTIGAIPVPKLPPVIPEPPQTTIPVTPKPPTPTRPAQPNTKTQLINVLNNLIHQIKTYQKSNVTIPTINIALQLIQTIHLPNETIMDELFYVYYLLQTHHSPMDVLSNVINILNNVSQL
jgi:hypothetical protein